MWRSRIDAFWDGRRLFAVGFFMGSGTQDTPFLAPELVVVSARNLTCTDQATLVDTIDARRLRGGPCILLLPPDHSYVFLRSANGAELCYALTRGESRGGDELRLLLIEKPMTPSSSPVEYRVTSLPDRGNVELLSQDHIAESGSNLIWVIGQSRHIERRDGPRELVQLWPTRHVFPTHRRRIVIQTAPYSSHIDSIALKAPFSIMEHWLREPGAPCATLRIRIPHSLEESKATLVRSGVVLVMHQRRHLRQWMREQKFFGDPSVDLLTFNDIQRATGRPSEHPDAAGVDDTIVIHNLSKLLANPKTTEFDGVSIRHRSESTAPNAGAMFDIEFFAAALGDDIGLVCTTEDDMDFGVLPFDPGGAPSVRLFRVESDGLQPLKIDSNDLLLSEILRVAVDEERSPVAGFTQITEGNPGEAEQHEDYLHEYNAQLSAAGYFGRFRATRSWSLFEPLFISSFVALATDSAPDARALLTKLGGFDAYLEDPSLVSALMRSCEFSREADEKSFHDFRRASKSLVHRVVGAAHRSGFVVGDIGLQMQIHIWRLLTQTSDLRRLTTAGIALNGSDELNERVFSVAELLLDEEKVERAAMSCDELDLPELAQELRKYLMKRKRGDWTSFDEAARLAGIVEESNARWKRIEAEQAAAAAVLTRRQQPARAGGVLATVKHFLARRRSGDPPN